jgi:hypothetical protein
MEYLNRKWGRWRDPDSKGDREGAVSEVEGKVASVVFQSQSDESIFRRIEWATVSDAPHRSGMMKTTK